MKKRYKIILSVLLPIVCITSVCMSFLFVGNKSNKGFETKDESPINKTRYEANYFATAEEGSPAQGQSASYKGGAVFLEPNSTFIMIGGTINGHNNTYGGAVFVSDGATFIMEGGTISDCDGTYGGAIYVSSGGTCTIIAGTITGNTANYGPSIYAEAGATITISEDTVIDENSVMIESILGVSTDTIAVGDPSANFNLHYIDFGSYPQWYVGNEMNDELESWYNTNKPTSVKTYYEGPTFLHNNNEAAYEYIDGNVYLRDASTSADGTFLNGDSFCYNSIYWFRIEPIRWVILNYEEFSSGNAETLEIMSWLAIEAASFYIGNGGDFSGDWLISNLRSYLNDAFYMTAFSEEEREMIASTTLENDEFGQSEDKIYVLSYNDYYKEEGLFQNEYKRLLCRYSRSSKI